MRLGARPPGGDGETRRPLAGIRRSLRVLVCVSVAQCGPNWEVNTPPPFSTPSGIRSACIDFDVDLRTKTTLDQPAAVVRLDLFGAGDDIIPSNHVWFRADRTWQLLRDTKVLATGTLDSNGCVEGALVQMAASRRVEAWVEDQNVTSASLVVNGTRVPLRQTHAFMQ